MCLKSSGTTLEDRMLLTSAITDGRTVGKTSFFQSPVKRAVIGSNLSKAAEQGTEP